ncbi:MAG: hypothetical protein HC877_03390 [Thioploca sp.]|nr:hypothetical protein [Thioploca sp.]
MATLIINEIDEGTLAKLQQEAGRRGVNINELAKQLIQSFFDSDSVIHHDLDKLSGTWTESEAKEFLSVTQDFSLIDKGIW